VSVLTARMNSRPLTRAAVMAGALALSGCQTPLSRDVARGKEAYNTFPATNPDAPLGEYRIGPLDVLDVSVFREPDLSVKSVTVDASGKILVPLIGQVPAAGRSANELSGELAKLLSAKFLESPNVVVTVITAASQQVTVEGSVNEAGVFQIKGHTTLLEALAMAKGTSRTAALSQTVVFRNIDGRRNAALFDLSKIQRGTAPDPEIQGSDIIVVGFSNLKSGFRDFLSSAPLLSLFRPF
jgi:polysaccharide export outer membrane protein